MTYNNFPNSVDVKTIPEMERKILRLKELWQFRLATSSKFSIALIKIAALLFIQQHFCSIMASANLSLPRTRRGAKLEKPLPLKRNVSVDENLTTTNCDTAVGMNKQSVDPTILKRSFSTGDNTTLEKKLKGEVFSWKYHRSVDVRC